MALAARQHGVVCHAQLVELGLDNSAIHRRVQTHRLQWRYRGVYAVGHPGLTLRGRELAAVLACGPEAVLSHRSAACLWGLLRSSSRGIEVTAPRTREARSGLTVHTTRCLGTGDRDVAEGVPVISVARTIVDLAEVLADGWLSRAIHEAEIRRLFDLRAVDDALARVPGRRGANRLRRVLASYRPENHEVASEAERRFLALCRDHGLPEPRGALIEGRQVDFYWPQARLAVEVDGGAYHHTRRAFQEDRSRDRALATLGIQVLRVTWADLRSPGAVARELAEVYKARCVAR